VPFLGYGRNIDARFLFLAHMLLGVCVMMMMMMMMMMITGKVKVLQVW